jgi:hypothetical protein
LNRNLLILKDKKLNKEGKMPTLRYYCQNNGDEEIQRLLAEIKEKKQIPYEIVDLSRNGEFSSENEKQAYEKDFKPRAKLLKQKAGQPITKLKSAKHGNYYVSMLYVVRTNWTVDALN